VHCLKVYSRKGKPIVRWGHKAHGSRGGMAGLPEKKRDSRRMI